MSNTLDISIDWKKAGERIKSVRIGTQKEWAKKLGTDQEMISRYENGKNPIPIDILFRVSVLTRKSIDWLLTGREVWTESAAESPSPYGLSEEERELLFLYMGADKITRKYAKEMLEGHQEKSKKNAGA